MATGLEVIPETAKAISAPLTKLIEVVSAGCGNLYKPLGIKRVAEAEAKAMLIMEEAKTRAREISMRAAQRILDKEEKRQENIEAICSNAVLLLPNEVSSDPVDSDWASHFFNECQDISNEKMRAVWSKILAGEVSQPGSFSKRTLSLLKNISAEEANLFNALCKSSFRSMDGKLIYPILIDGQDQEYFKSIGLNFICFQRLMDAGLLLYNPIGLIVEKTKNYAFLGSNLSLLYTSDSPGNLPLGKISISTSGAQLSKICEWDIPKERFDLVFGRSLPGFNKNAIKVISTKGFEFTYEEVDYVNP